ncbi:MAG: START domain-containing protein [Myxococcota bacterium]|nr:START domain-containing protein [Myxococcota bacterium]
MIHMKRFCVLVLILFAAPVLAERTVVTEEDGVRVEAEGAEGRLLPILIGTTRIAASPEQVASWIRATHTHESWMHNCEEAWVVRRDKGVVVGYSRIGSPWPVSDRDVVTTTKRSDLEDGRILIEFQSIDDDSVPRPRGSVRMKNLKGSYELTPVEGGTAVVYTVDSDPGGNLPGWLVRDASKDLPLQTLKKLRSRAESGPPPPA